MTKHNKKTITLPIKELALLKSNPKKYYKKHMTNKTHDGTSMGTLSPKIKEFSEKYASSKELVIDIYDKEGWKQEQIYGLHPDLFPDKYKFDKTGFMKDIDEGYDTDMDIVRNAGHEESDQIDPFSYVLPHTYDSEYSYKNQYVAPNEDDLSQLIRKNEDGEYSFRSITMVSPNQSSITFMKNKDFSKEDEKLYNELIKKFNEDNQNFVQEYEATFSETYASLYGDEKYNDDMNHVHRRDDSVKESTKQNGTLYDHIKNQDWEKQFSECNVKIRIKEKP